MTTISSDVRAIPIKSEVDILEAIQHARSLAASLQFSPSDQIMITVAISEVARNSVVHADEGLISIRVSRKGNQAGLIVVAEDCGPGISDIALAMQDGYSTSNSLGIGLPGAKRMMDEFDIESEVGKGTIITMKKWKH